MSYTATVREFTVACNQELPLHPTTLTQQNIRFIRKMVTDELNELDEAEDVTEQADALIDAIYYLCDCAVRHGINLDRLFEIVHAANMRKVVDGRVSRRVDGKILKPAAWKDPLPELQQEIQRQRTQGAWDVVKGATKAC